MGEYVGWDRGMGEYVGWDRGMGEYVGWDRGMGEYVGWDRGLYGEAYNTHKPENCFWKLGTSSQWMVFK
jgi:hypothetical protein